ncbi:DUF4111 domain-containing protein [Dactylosporangium fulvum]|uniref:DUF4111 domain-containing protein n=1 Tax=Dactylosporangium fulvum TaxID=53359 RepID=A0ABY5WC69_9ACTN|nr:aminoglycoside adenylyltransferase domain-containing protein [Dactylosporangium fulvum]UWP87117.1 DUF4111 domain-containing protein [Dactylosporangium fulvum]
MAPIEEIAAGLARSATAAAGVPVRSAILHGSVATGDFLPGRSDIDLLLVVGGPLPDTAAGALERLVRNTDPGPASGIDLHVVTAAVASAPSPAPPLELHVGRYDGSSVGVEVERRVAAAPDLPAELSMARADGRAVLGAAPADVLGPVPAAWVRDRGRHWLREWQSRTGDTEDAAHMVLTACRIWLFAVEGRHSAKTPAARWALERDPSLTAIPQALHQYTTDPAAPVSEAGIARVLETVLRDDAV